jgi:hypothetical protein
MTEHRGLKYDRALELMRRGDRLVMMHAKTGFEYFLLKGGYVTHHTAKRLKEFPLIRGGKDGLFPNHEQTWRIIS